MQTQLCVVYTVNVDDARRLDHFDVDHRSSRNNGEGEDGIVTVWISKGTKVLVAQ